MAAPRRQAAHQIDNRKRTEDVLLSDGVQFSSLLLSKPVLEGLSSSGFQRPSPIQLKAIPLGRCGLDLIVQAKSGTGKTCVFATIALDSLVLENAATQVLVLAPTREIAVQIHSVVMSIGSAMEGLECHVFIGGRPVSQDKLRLKKCHIAIGSPGRIKQLIELGALLTASIRLFVLDEADKLLEEGSFQEQINWIFSSLPLNKQMLALSATYPESLAQHLCRYMREPTFVRLNPTDPGLIGLKQYYKLVHAHALPHKIFEEKVQNLLELFSKIPFNQALVFSNLHTRAQHLADVLSSKGLPSVCISGSLSQEQRLEAMSKLKQYQCRVLISTDLTSRGIDAEKVNLVINLDVPQDWETYMHRIGRAGRFGTMGLAVTYCCHGEEENKMMAIAQKCDLALNQLPDPITASLMEEQCDWGVTVQPPSKSDLTFSVEHKVDRKKRATSEPASESKTSKQPQRSAFIKDQPEHRGGSAKTQSASGDRKKIRKPAEAGAPPVSTSRPGAPPPTLEPPSGLSRAEMEEALPKIPPLPCFKAPPQRSMTFAEAVADFENFITAGPGRDVEIIRSYGGRDEGNAMFNGHVVKDNDAEDASPKLYSQNKDQSMCKRSSNSISRPNQSSITSDTSSSSSESESEMETELKTDASASSSVSSAPRPTSYTARTSKQPPKSRQKLIKPHPQRHPHYHPQIHIKPGSDMKQMVGKEARTENASAHHPQSRIDHHHHHQHSKPGGETTKKMGKIARTDGASAHHPHLQSQACTPHVHYQHHHQQQRSKSGPEKENKRVDEGSWRKKQRTRTEEEEEEEEECSEEEEEKDKEDGEEEEEEDDEDYWRTYYQAWDDYYSSLGSAYYYNSPYNWLAAYRMNMVYMMEMMKH
ncbi:putative ATP-dependent RNA helicase DDX20 [Astyanax mexicanus]|uniref:RNA helicase n=1 Tax=Astyanax mexicanus TaxID=7994 RepID=A0A8T2LH20_ASTMX|nr:putative ATP-dependent RNA helicase DDX20 [Astyanax mexicanus]